MKNPLYKASGYMKFTLPAIAGLVLVSCSEPTKKPIPALKPEVEKTAEVKTQVPTKAVQKKESPAQTGSVTGMSVGDLYQLVQSNAALIYDVRPTLYYKMGHIPNAISWPRKDFEKKLAQHEAVIRNANASHTPVVLYCTDMACPDAQGVATELVKRGHTVSILQGGYAAWKMITD